MFILASNFAKPSFLQVFLPTVVLFLIVEIITLKEKIFSFCVKQFYLLFLFR